MATRTPPNHSVDRVLSPRVCTMPKKAKSAKRENTPENTLEKKHKLGFVPHASTPSTDKVQ
jgi:hypothetical protein